MRYCFIVFGFDFLKINNTVNTCEGENARCHTGYKGSKLVGELMIFEMNIPANVIVSVIFA